MLPRTFGTLHLYRHLVPNPFCAPSSSMNSITMALSSATPRLELAGPTLPKSTLTGCRMGDLAFLGHIDSATRRLLEENERIPNPPSGYIVCTEAHAIYRVRFLKSSFFASILAQCGIEL